MNAYIEMKNRQQEEVNAFPMAFAFNQKQLEEGMRKLGLDPSETDKVCSLFGAGDFLRKTDVPAFAEMSRRHRSELKAAMDADETGEGFIFEAFDAELSNHEYGYTGDATDALAALGITREDLEKDARLMHGFKKACKSQMDWYNEHN